MLLDEPTASMDAQLETRVMQHLFREISKESAKKELKEYSNFEIFNHTFNHVDLQKTNKDKTYTEIKLGKIALQNYFQRYGRYA